MGDFARGRLDLDDDERLPWLEPGIEDEEEEGLSPVRLLGFIFVALILLGASLAASGCSRIAPSIMAKAS